MPGGPGVNALMEDVETLSFIRSLAKGARYVTSVCTGALVLGAAGLLKGRRATTHWLSLDLLPHFGAVPAMERVVLDGNLITGGGVTSGIDFALTLVSLAAGEETARLVQLSLEYDPAPPWDSGHPDRADPRTVEEARRRAAVLQAERLAIAKRVAVG